MCAATGVYALVGGRNRAFVLESCHKNHKRKLPKEETNMKSDFLTNLFFRALQTVSIATMLVRLLLPVAILTGVVGLSFQSVRTAAILSTTSMPATTLPKAAYWPSRWGAS